MRNDIKRAMVTGGTKTDVAAMGVFALNVKETNSEIVDKLIIFHDGISSKDQFVIQNIFPTEFIRYRLPFKPRNDNVVNYFSPMLFCKYECFRLLEYYEEVIWSDYDVVIEERLDDICEFSTHKINIVVNRDIHIRDMFFKTILNEEIYKYDLKREAICTPLFSISRDIGDYMSMYDWCYNKTVEYETDMNLMEQCIISLLMQEFDIDYQGLSNDEYALHPKYADGTEKILHAYGQPKFWNGLENEKWDELYAEWLNMGGSRYCGVKKKIMSKIRLVMSRICGVRSKQ